FGMTAEEVTALKKRGYRPELVAQNDRELAHLLEVIRGDRFSPGEPGLFEPLVRSLLEHDPFCVLADFRAYAECQKKVARAWTQREVWSRMAILNVAGMGTFSSDRAIREYVRRVWKTEPVAVTRARG